MAGAASGDRADWVVAVLARETQPGLVPLEHALGQAGVPARVVGPDAAVAMRTAAECSARVIMVDLRLGAVVQELAGAVAVASGVRLLGLCAGDAKEPVWRALDSGIVNFVALDADGRELAEAIKRAGEGRGWVSEALLDQVLGAARAGLAFRGALLGQSAQRVTAVRASVAAPGALQAVFQPIVDLRDGQPFGALAAIRFADQPDEPIGPHLLDARRVGIAVEFELAAVRCVLADAARLPQRSLLFIRVSGETIADGRANELLGEFAGRTVLELSGHSLPAEAAAAFATQVQRLRDDGVRFAVDEQWAGLGELERVLELAPGFMRLSGGLARDVEVDRARRALALAVLTFASRLGARVIAGGIDSEQELTTLRGLGVPYGVGVHLGPAAPLGEPAGDTAAARASTDAPPPAPVLWALGSAGALELPPRARASFAAAASAVVRLLAARLPEDCALCVEQLDGEQQRCRVVESHGAGVEPGRAVPFEDSLAIAVLSGAVPQVLDGDSPGADALALARRLGVSGWLVVPFAGPPEQPSAVLTVLAREPGALPDDVLESVRAGAAALRDALDAEHGSVPDVVHEALRELSWRDRFSGLLNRARMDELLEQAAMHALSGQSGSYIVQVKLTNFRALCDRMGQTLGELVLKDVARALERHAEPDDVLAHAAVATFGCLLFGRDEREAAFFCQLVGETVEAGSRRRAALVELAIGYSRILPGASGHLAWLAAGERVLTGGAG